MAFKETCPEWIEYRAFRKSLTKSVDEPGFYTCNGEVFIGNTVDSVMNAVSGAETLYVRQWNGGYEDRTDVSEDEFRHLVELALTDSVDDDGNRYRLYGFFSDFGSWTKEILYQN